ALIEKFSKPSGVSDEERLVRAAAIIKRAANNGLTEIEVTRFPNALCTDRGRAINQREPGWEKHLPAIQRNSTTFGKGTSKLADTRLDFKSSTSPGGYLAILGSRCGGNKSRSLALLRADEVMNDVANVCFFGTKRTYRGRVSMSAFGVKRTSREQA